MGMVEFTLADDTVVSIPESLVISIEDGRALVGSARNAKDSEGKPVAVDVVKELAIKAWQVK